MTPCLRFRAALLTITFSRNWRHKTLNAITIVKRASSPVVRGYASGNARTTLLLPTQVPCTSHRATGSCER
jgi:hypothetical protein